MEEEKKETEVKPEEKSTGTRYGGFWVRFLALIIDGIVVAAVTRPFTGLIPSPSYNLGLGSGISESISSLTTLISWAYYVIMTRTYGATLGKMVFSLKVVNYEGKNVDWVTAILREIVGKAISGILLLLGFVWAGFDSKKQGWHDKIAKTYVVYK